MTIVQNPEEILSREGPFSLFLEDFEEREEQKGLMGDVFRAYEEKQIALLEAGPGTGKSLAYLIPAILWAKQNKERTVISTHTITLQEQLIHKDIPIVKKALGHDFEAVLLKGMGNYVCLRKLDDIEEEKPHFSLNEREEIETIERWADKTDDGSRSSLPVFPSHTVWERVSAEPDTCTYRKCPHFKDCHVMKARQEAQEAQVIVVNHYLLLADLIQRSENPTKEESTLLPPYQRLVIDEAHHLEEVATECLAHRFNRLLLIKNLTRLISERGGLFQGKLPLLAEKLSQKKTFLSRLMLEIPSLNRSLYEHLDRFEETFESFIKKNFASESGKVRLRDIHQKHPDWKEQIFPRGSALVSELNKFCETVSSLIEKIAKEEKLEGSLVEIEGLTNRLQTTADQLQSLLSEKEAENVRWFESKTVQQKKILSLCGAKLDVSPFLKQFLFNPLTTVVLSSATLATENHFSYVKKRLGVELRNITEKIYASPFDFQKQALLAVPKDLPLPNEPGFIDASVSCIQEAIHASRGSAFVLFTSYEMLDRCYDKIDIPYDILRQGDDHRNRLLKTFKQETSSVLFGTDSFWEGVDIAGEALRLVIIVKLPFKVPTDPLIQARSESIKQLGGDPFMDYSLPQAIMKFKQGFGRLIRKRADRGAVLCLDSRLIQKRYGRAFIQSLPTCQNAFDDWKTISQQLKQFYSK